MHYKGTVDDECLNWVAPGKVNQIQELCHPTIVHLQLHSALLNWYKNSEYNTISWLFETEINYSTFKSYFKQTTFFTFTTPPAFDSSLTFRPYYSVIITIHYTNSLRYCRCVFTCFCYFSGVSVPYFGYFFCWPSHQPNIIPKIWAKIQRRSTKRKKNSFFFHPFEGCSLFNSVSNAFYSL